MQRRQSSQRIDTRTDRLGTVTVEFALIASLIFFLFFASLEVARVNMIRNSVENAVYEGARVAIVPGGTAADAQAEAERLIALLAIKNATVTVSPTTIDDATTTVTVTASVPIEDNLWTTALLFGGKTMTKSCQLEREEY